ncbi:alcohol dehydrogenase [Niastella vici]|uniref:Alcohol dehydrogenase n=1 Tax=Niastella vici TaxID=1703345 RepID=A0A1V9FLK8_9BACT|nr:glucose 1-dehydrogenase [Niastella vici]OQP59233.1 alcohol dehydrogenase [Niastella vici]
MKAVSLVPHTTNISLKDIDEPQISSPNDIKIKVLQGGICGTDREEAEGGRADAPAGKHELVIGHEMFGVVVETGSEVKAVSPGDYGLFTVRRGCGACEACLKDRPDMCFSGRYTERGIRGADGFQTEFVVDQERYFIKVPGEIKHLGVLTEPMSVAAKAIDEALIIQQARLHGIIPAENWLKGRKALVAGLGPIGLLAAFALRLQGANVIGLDIVDENSLRANILKEIGGIYIDGRVVKTTDVDDACGEVDFVFEATGITQLQLQLIDTLAVNGIYVATGIPAGDRPLTIMAGEILQQLVLKNQILLGSVNASMLHYRMAVDYLQKSRETWPGVIEKVITNKIPYSRFQEAIFSHTTNEIRVVVDWADGM